MKKIMLRLLAAAMLLSAITVTEGAVTAGAKKIGSFAAAKKLALKKVPSAAVTELDTDMENGAMVYDVELVRKNKEYKLKYRASDGKLLEYGWETMHPAVTNQNKKNLSRKAMTKKAKKQVKGASVCSIKLKFDDGMSQYCWNMSGRSPSAGKRRQRTVISAWRRQRPSPCPRRRGPLW